MIVPEHASRERKRSARVGMLVQEVMEIGGDDRDDGRRDDHGDDHAPWSRFGQKLRSRHDERAPTQNAAKRKRPYVNGAQVVNEPSLFGLRGRAPLASFRQIGQSFAPCFIARLQMPLSPRWQ